MADAWSGPPDDDVDGGGGASDGRLVENNPTSAANADDDDDAAADPPNELTPVHALRGVTLHSHQPSTSHSLSAESTQRREHTFR